MESVADKFWACKACDNPLVQEADRITYVRRSHISPSDRDIPANGQLQPKFRATYGKGFLYRKAYNFTLDAPKEMEMTTGLHTVRDIRCGRCNQYVGWKYEKAQHESENYKIGKYLMEGEMLKSVTGLISDIQARL